MNLERTVARARRHRAFCRTAFTCPYVHARKFERMASVQIALRYVIAVHCIPLSFIVVRNILDLVNYYMKEFHFMMCLIWWMRSTTKANRSGIPNPNRTTFPFIAQVMTNGGLIKSYLSFVMITYNMCTLSHGIETGNDCCSLCFAP